MDAAGPLDRLGRSVIDAGDERVLRRRFDSPAARLRAAADVRRMGVRRVTAWSPRAFQVATSSGVQHVTYRPPAHVARVPDGADLILAHSDEQRRRLGKAAETRVAPILPAVAIPRGELGVEEDDVLWLLSDDEGPTANLSLAVWAGAVQHVLMRREGRRHRLVLHGDGPRLRRAKRFLDQLGLPDLGVPAGDGGASYEALAATADAALFTPNGLCDPWPALAANAAGLPVVTTNRPEVLATLRDADARVVKSFLPREVARAMLEATPATRASI